MKTLSSLFCDELDDDLKALYATIGQEAYEERIFRIQFLRILNDIADSFVQASQETPEGRGH